MSRSLRKQQPPAATGGHEWAGQEATEHAQTTTPVVIRTEPSQLSLLGRPAPQFDGATVQAEDVPRLSGQLATIAELVSDRRWWTLRDLAERAACSEASASARLRDLRKPRFGSHTIERRRRDGGLFEYRLGAEAP